MKAACITIDYYDKQGIWHFSFNRPLRNTPPQSNPVESHDDVCNRKETICNLNHGFPANEYHNSSETCVFALCEALDSELT